MNRLTSIWKTLLAVMLVLMLAMPALADEALPQETVTLETEAPTEAEPVAEAEPAAEAAPVEPLTSETVLATVNGTNVTYKEVKKYYDMLMTQYQGMLDTSAEDIQSAFKNMAISYAATEELVKQKAHELGTDVFTEEEEAAFKQSADATYGEMLEQYKSMFAGEGVSEEDQLKSAEAYLESNGYTHSDVLYQYKLSEIYTRTFLETIGEITLTDEDVRAAFDELVQEKKSAYAADLAQYDADKRSGTVYYTPEGVRAVKHILFKVDNASTLKSLNEQLAALPEGDAGAADIKAQIDEIMSTVQPKLDEVQQKLDAGEDFDMLVAEYGEDGGMTSEPYITEGYYVSEATTMYDPPFKEAAMALENVGDISEPTLGVYGFHIIRYDHDVASGEADFESLKESLRESELDTMKTEAESAALQEWSQAAVIEMFTERFV